MAIPRNKKLLYIGLAAAGLVLLCGLLFPKTFLCVDHTQQTKADALIVLGGEGAARAEHAAKLYQLGLAPNVIVSGDGDNEEMCSILARAGVPETALFKEERSGNTKENAQFASAILHSNQFKTAILVTSWYHSRRALKSFQRFSPGVSFSSKPVYPEHTLGARIWFVAMEYLKTCWYVARHGIWPV